MERYTDTTSSLQKSLPSILNPLTQINYVLGTFPYCITSKHGKVVLSSKSFHFFRAIFTFALITLTILTTFYRAYQIFTSPTALTPNGEKKPVMAKLVELVCAFYANCITLIVLGLTFFKRHLLQNFFNGMETYAQSLRSYIDPLTVSKRIRKLYLLYGFLAVNSAAAAAIRYYINPYMGPISVLFEVLGIDGDVSPDVTAALSAIFIFYIALAKFACLGYVEIVSCGLAKCLSRCMENIMEYLETQTDSWGSQFRGLKSQVLDKDDFMNLLATTTVSGRSSASNNNSPKFKFQNDLENYIDQIRELNPGLIATDHISVSPKLADSGPKFTFGSKLLKTTPGKALSHAARSFTSVAQMQNVTNSVFGHTLAVNIGCIVGMSVILKYLVIKSIVTDLKAPVVTLPFAPGLLEPNSMPNLNLTLDNDTFWTETGSYTNETLGTAVVNVKNHTNPYHVDELEWLMFLGLDISMFVRLGVVILCLGKVYQTSLTFNAVMSRSFLMANRLIDEFAETLQTSENASAGDIEDIVKTLMTPTQTSSIIAFMNLYNAHPVAFTAGGLFVFSSGLLLMIISIIISYLVFLLQA